MKTKITTDWHIGVKRSAGTTPYSAIALRSNLIDALAAQLDDNDHLIAGDLLDDFTVDTGELVRLYQLLSEWLERSGRNLALLRGNHDYHQSAQKLSSFDLLGTILKQQFPDQVTVAAEVTEWKQFILVPHLANAELFKMAVDDLSQVRDRVLVFHANIDSNFCDDSQHSLNLTRDQLEDMVGRGNLVISGHEHQQRTMCDGRVLVLGNGAPSSVADCLGNAKKFSAMVTGTEYSLSPIWSAADAFCRVNWQDLDQVPDHAQFVRVEGDCTADQAADMVNVVSKLRQKHSAFVISNSTSVAGVVQMEGLAKMSLESVEKFDVLSALLEDLTTQEQAVVTGLLK